MKKLIRIAVILFFVHPSPGVSQMKRICVMGSSSAYGYFPGSPYPRDSAWAFKVKEHFKSAVVIDTLYNIGTPGIDCYIGMPTGYVPPAGRNSPNTEFNITRAVNFVPAPDVIIINFPSNNYTVLSITEILFCLQTMKDYANARNIRCYITTTQPRNDFVQFVEREKLREIRDSIIARFGVFAIDFWADIVQEPSLFLRPEYNLGDGVHLTPIGHTVLKNKVIERDIFFGPVALGDGKLTATERGDHVLVNWKLFESASFDHYQLERGRGEGRFQPFHYFSSPMINAGTMTFIDDQPYPGINLYRVAATDAEGHTSYSRTAAVNFDGSGSSMPYLFPTVVSTSFQIVLPPCFSSEAIVVDEGGRVVSKIRFTNIGMRRVETVKVPKLGAGLYRVYFKGSGYLPLTFIKK